MFLECKFCYEEDLAGDMSPPLIISEELTRSPVDMRFPDT